MNFNLRNATLDDIDSIMKVESAGFIKKIQEERKVFESRIVSAPELFLIFEDENKNVAGYLSSEYLKKIPQEACEIALGHNPQKMTDEKNIIYLSSFSILPEYRGKGNGSLLWKKSLEYLQKKIDLDGTFVLLVNEVWKGAYKIYENSRFTKVKVFKDFFSAENNNKTDGILMICKAKNCKID